MNKFIWLHRKKIYQKIGLLVLNPVIYWNCLEIYLIRIAAIKIRSDNAIVKRWYGITERSFLDPLLLYPLCRLSHIFYQTPYFVKRYVNDSCFSEWSEITLHYFHVYIKISDIYGILFISWLFMFFDLNKLLFCNIIFHIKQFIKFIIFTI